MLQSCNCSEFFCVVYVAAGCVRRWCRLCRISIGHNLQSLSVLKRLLYQHKKQDSTRKVFETFYDTNWWSTTIYFTY